MPGVAASKSCRTPCNVQNDGDPGASGTSGECRDHDGAENTAVNFGAIEPIRGSRSWSEGPFRNRAGRWGARCQACRRRRTRARVTGGRLAPVAVATLRSVRMRAISRSDLPSSPATTGRSSSACSSPSPRHGRPVHWTQDVMRRAAMALRECSSSDIFTATRAVLEAAIRSESDLIELLSPDTAAMSALPLPNGHCEDGRACRLSARLGRAARSKSAHIGT
jgi:hypothetical protein